MTTIAGKLLRINLTSFSSSVEEIPSEFYERYISARGLGVKYLYDELKPGTGPTDPDNKLIFAVGILAGTGVQGFSRWTAVTKSPLTGTVFRSISGGKFGVWMKHAGFDLMIIEGKAERLTNVLINKDTVQFLDAGEFRGLNYRDLQVRFKEIYGKRTETVCIGEAGEKLVKLAAIAANERTAARGGVGAVMGSKNLKAVSINVPSGNLPPFDPDEFKTLSRHQRDILKDHPRRENMHTFGTTYITTVLNHKGILPTRNFQEGSIASVNDISSTVYHQSKKGAAGCYSCSTRCGGLRDVENGPFKGSLIDGPEYETIFAFGSLLDVTDSQFIVDANALCDFYSMDTISVGVCVAFAVELFERGIITKIDTGGLCLNWGNKKDLFTLITQIGAREGFGELLGEGVKKAAALIGDKASQYAMHSKGLELAGYEPRAVKGYGLSMATSNIGGSHMYGRPRKELSGETNPYTETNKGASIARVQKEQAVEDSLIACTFGNSGLDMDSYSRFLHAATGLDAFDSSSKLLTIGERILCLERCFNIREGFNRADDSLPDRMLNEPLKNAGPATGQMIENLNDLLDEYYDELGYTREGIPGKETLQKLNLDIDLKAASAVTE